MKINNPKKSHSTRLAKLRFDKGETDSYFDEEKGLVYMRMDLETKQPITYIDLDVNFGRYGELNHK